MANIELMSMLKKVASTRKKKIALHTLSLGKR